MNIMHRIRKDVFEATQAEMADIARVSQATISRWEAGTFDPSLENMKAIRAEARRRRLDWDDTVFFGDGAEEAIDT